MKVPSFAFKKKSDDEVPILPRTEDDLKKVAKEETVATEEEVKQYKSNLEEQLKNFDDPEKRKKIAINIAKIKKMQDVEKKLKGCWDLFSSIFFVFSLLLVGFLWGRAFSKSGLSTITFNRPFLNYSLVPKTMSLEAYAAADIYLRKHSGYWWTYDEYKGFRTALGMIGELESQKVISCDWKLEDGIGFFNELDGAKDESTTEEKQETAIAKDDEEMPVDDVAGDAEEKEETVEEVDKEEYDETYDNFYNDEIEMPKEMKDV